VIDLWDICRTKKSPILITNISKFSPIGGRAIPALVKLYNKYRMQGFEVLAFECHQFSAAPDGRRIPHDELASFYQTQYGANFKIFPPIYVNGPTAHPVFQYLRSKEQCNKLASEGRKIPGDFSTFLLNGEGTLVQKWDFDSEPANLSEIIESY
jgi:glutathione peroxidase